MPYIDQKGREKFKPVVELLGSLRISDNKELAVLIRLFIDCFMGNYRDSWVVCNSDDKFISVEKLLHQIFADNNGELNYLITKTIKSYIDCHGEKYQNYDDVINAIDRVYSDINKDKSFTAPCGTLSCVKHELFRRKIDPYENLKIQENGDVY